MNTNTKAEWACGHNLVAGADSCGVCSHQGVTTITIGSGTMWTTNAAFSSPTFNSMNLIGLTGV